MFAMPEKAPLIKDDGAAVEAPLMALRVFLLRATMAFMLAASLLSGAAFLSHVQEGNAVHASYISALSVIITLVAAYHYREILKVRTYYYKDMSTKTTELVVDGLRHSDWLVTLPLLVLKLFALINNSKETVIIVDNAPLSALFAMLMVLMGAFARLGLEGNVWLGGCNGGQNIISWLLYIGSCVILVLLLIDLGGAQSGSAQAAVVWSFFLVWPGYAVIAIGSVLVRHSWMESKYPEYMSFLKDIGYALLDLWSKAVFAWYTASLAYGVRFL